MLQLELRRNDTEPTLIHNTTAAYDVVEAVELAINMLSIQHPTSRTHYIRQDDEISVVDELSDYEIREELENEVGYVEEFEVIGYLGFEQQSPWFVRVIPKPADEKNLDIFFIDSDMADYDDDDWGMYTYDNPMRD